MIVIWGLLPFLVLTLDGTSAFVVPGGAIPGKSPRGIGSATGLNAVARRNLAVAGRIPWKKLLVTKSQGREIVSIMRAETHVSDVVAMFVLTFYTERIAKFFYARFLHRFRDKVNYNDSITCQVIDTITEASRLAVLCYFIDAIEVALEVTGLKGHKIDVSTLIAKLIYGTWACFRARMYKRSFFTTFIDHMPKKTRGTQSLVEVFDKVSDFFLFGVLGLMWIDILKIKRGNVLSSIFALGGASTFAFTLACQDLAKRLINSLALAASDAFNVGDYILLGDGTQGKVESMGWLNTEIRGSDELVTRIPNTQLASIRISNYSRVEFSQVKQHLHFTYDDIDKIPDLCSRIRDEIAASCPKVVTDGSRAFRVGWVDFGPKHVEVLVDCRVRNPPGGDKYFEAKQGILEAIARAVHREKVEYAVK